MKASIIVALTVGLFTFAASGDAVRSAHAGDGAKALKLLPADSNIVLNLNVKRLRTGKAFDEILDRLRQNSDFKETETALTDAGVNFKKDFDTVTFGARSDGKGDPTGMVVVAEGRFKQAKILAALKKKNADTKVRKHRGVTYFTFGDDGAIAFVGKNMLMAENEHIKATIDRAKRGGKSAAKSRSLKKLLAKTDTKRDMWFAVEILGGASAGVPMADKLESAAGSFDLLKGLTVNMRISFKDTTTPKELVSQYGMLKGMVGSNPDAKRMGLDVVVAKAKVLADEKDVVFSVALTPQEAMKLKGAFDTLGGAM